MNVQCHIEVAGRTAAGIRVMWTASNEGTQAVHLLHTARMPYVLVPSSDRAVLSWAVQAPEPGKNYGMIQLPSTIPLLPGAKQSGEVLLAVPLEESSHLRSPTRYQGVVHDPLQVVAEFGFLDHELPKNPIGQSYYKIVESMHRCESAPVTVSLGAGR